MNKRIISFITALFMAVTILVSPVYVAASETQTGGLVWSYRDTSNSAMTGITSPATDESGEYIYAASAKQFYKLNASDGKLDGKVTLSGSVGYNKIAPVIAEGKAFIPLGAGKLDIVDTETMKLLKTVQFADAESHKGHQTLTPAIYDEGSNSVYLGTWRRDYGGIYATVSLNDYSVKTIAESTEGFYWAGACTEGEYVVFGSTSNGTDDMNTPSDGDAVLYAWNKSDGTLIETELIDSGSICTTVVASDGKYYFVSKSGKLYEASIEDGVLNAAVKTQLAAKSTCTPIIKDGKAYIGSASKVEVAELLTGEITESYDVPADVKGLAVCGDKIYCTYNEEPGGLYDARTGMDFFVPYESMQQYCISTVVSGADGTLYYSNDSNNVMAVRAGYVQKPAVTAQKTVTAKLIGANDFQISWSKQTIEGFTVKYKVQYQKYGGSWITYKAAATGTSCKKYNLANGGRYRFKVTPFVVSGGKTYSGTAKVTGYIYTLKTPKQPVAKRVNATSATLKWNKVNGATCYKVYRSAKKNGTYKCVQTVKTLSTKVTAKKGAQYYYKVRACKGTVLGQMSPVKYYKFK